MTTGGYTDVAEALSARYGVTVSRQQVFQWWKRGTRNADGTPFPRGRRKQGVPAHRPAQQINIEAALAWAMPGVPGEFGKGWRSLDEQIVE